jgi:hypothetical protein
MAIAYFEGGGSVSAAQALQHSESLPAVDNEDLTNLLSNCNLSHLGSCLLAARVSQHSAKWSAPRFLRI